MNRNHLLIVIGFLVAAFVGSGAVCFLAIYTTISGRPAFLLAICAGFVSLIIYVAVATKLGF